MTLRWPSRGEELGGEVAQDYVDGNDELLSAEIDVLNSGVGNMRNEDNLAFLTDYSIARAYMAVDSSTEVNDKIATVVEDIVVGSVSASSVTFTPDGSISATDVQAAIQEVRDEIGVGTGDMLAANNLSDLVDAAVARINLGLGTAAVAASGDFQPTDADLTAIAALTTTSFGRSLLALADAAAGRTALALGTAAQNATGDFDLAGLAAQALVDAKAYADLIAAGFQPRAACKVATAAALPTCTYANGTAGVGATLTATGNGALTVDGVAVAVSDRVLVKDQASGFQNGIYTVTAPLGDGSHPFILTRATDADASAEVPSGMVTFITGGTAPRLAGTFVQLTAGPITVGTTAQVFDQAAASTSYTFSHGLVNTAGNIAPTFGTATDTFAQGNDARLSDARTPTTHATSHQSGGSDALTLAQAQVTNLVTDLAAKQPIDSDLTAIAALTTTSFGRGVLTLADASALRTLAGLAIGFDVQAYNVNLAGIAGLTSAADRLPYFTGVGGASALATFTAAGRALIDDADAAAQRTTLGLGAAAVLTSIDVDLDTVPSAYGTLADFTTASTVRSLNGAKIANAMAPLNAWPLRRYREKLATAADAPLTILMLGDSITEGVGLDDGERWPDLLAGTIGNAAGATVSRYLPALGLVGGNGWTYDGSSSPSGVATLGKNGIGYRSAVVAAAATHTLANEVDSCTGFRLFYTTGPTWGSFDIKIDGVTATTIDAYHASTTVAATWDSSTLTRGTHTISIVTKNTGHNATYTVDIAGVLPFDGNETSGVWSFNGGHSFSPSWTPGVAPSTQVELDMITLVDPDVVFLNFGANDITLIGGSTPETTGGLPAFTKANFVNSFNAITAAISHPVSFVFSATWGANVDDPLVWETYISVIYEAAIECGATFINFYEALGHQDGPNDLSDTSGHTTAEGAYAYRDVVIGGLGVAATAAANSLDPYAALTRLTIGALPSLRLGDGSGSYADLSKYGYLTRNTADEWAFIGPDQITAPAWNADGSLGGSTVPARFLGGIDTGSPPSGGSPEACDFVVSDLGGFYVRTAAGAWSTVPNLTFISALLAAKSPIASPTFTGTVASTGGIVNLTDGTGSHGQLDLLVGGTDPYMQFLDAVGDTQAKMSLTTDRLQFGAGGGSAPDFKFRRTGSAAGVVDGVLTLTSPVFNTGVSGTAIDTDSTMAANSDTKLASQKAVKTAIAAVGGDGYTTFSNAAYTVLSTDRSVFQIGTMSASRTVTLCAASAVPAGRRILIGDSSGTVTSSNTIVIARAGSDTINGGTFLTISTAHGYYELVSDGVSDWKWDFSRLVKAANLSDLPSAATARTNLSLPTNIDTLTLPASTTISTFGASLVDDANAAAALTTLGLDADLATFALPASTTISAYGATLVDDANAAAALATLGLDADLATLSLPASTTISATGASLIDDASVAAMLVTLGLKTATLGLASDAGASYSDTVTVTSLFAGSLYDLPANSLAAGDIITIEAWGTYLNNSGATRNITIQSFFDAVNGGGIATSGTLLAANAVARTFRFTQTIRVVSTGGSGVLKTVSNLALSALLSAGVDVYSATGFSSSVVVDTTQALTVDLKSTLGNATTVQTVACHGITVQKTPAP